MRADSKFMSVFRLDYYVRETSGLIKNDKNVLTESLTIYVCLVSLMVIKLASLLSNSSLELNKPDISPCLIRKIMSGGSRTSILDTSFPS